MICLPWTLQEIKDNYGHDLVENALKPLTGITETQYQFLYSLMWSTYRNRMIGKFNYREWEVDFNDQAIISWAWYSKIAETLDNPDLISQIDNTDTEDEHIDTKAKSEYEHLPDVPISTYQYLDNRNNDEGSSDRHREINHTSGRFLQTTNQVADDLREFTTKFIKEFDYLFSKRW